MRAQQCKKKRNSWIHFGKRVTQNIDSISFTKWTNIRHRSESRDKLDGAETVTSYENKRIIWVGNVGRWYETGIYCTTIIPTKFSEITSFSLSAKNSFFRKLFFSKMLCSHPTNPPDDIQRNISPCPMPMTRIQAKSPLLAFAPFLNPQGSLICHKSKGFIPELRLLNSSWLVFQNGIKGRT